MRYSKWTFAVAPLCPVVAGYTYARNAGQVICEAHCSVCHGDNGKGAVPGAPNLTQKGGVLSVPKTVLAQRIEHGYRAAGAPMAMPPKGGDSALTRQQIKQVLGYIRSKFGA